MPPSSPKRLLSPFELTRYLDYCSEMLSLAAKVAASQLGVPLLRLEPADQPAGRPRTLQSTGRGTGAAAGSSPSESRFIQVKGLR